MKTINESWLEYLKLCYPKDISKIQYYETRQTFFAGAMVVLSSLMEIANGKNEETGADCVEKMMLEIMSELQSRADTARAG